MPQRTPHGFASPGRGALGIVLGLGALLWQPACRDGGGRDRDPTIGPAHPDFLTRGFVHYSQHDEELIVRHYFQDRERGFFVDVGCAHYKNRSTTYFLEKHLGWKGIGIDALPEYGPEYAEHRPRTKFFAYLVSDKSDATERFYRAKHLREASSTSAHQSNEQSERLKGKTGVEATEAVTVKLDDLLDREGVTKVDFLSMDIEGGEALALRGFDIGRFEPDLVCVEHGGAGAQLLDYFSANGYERIDAYLERDKVNWYFRPRR